MNIRNIIKATFVKLKNKEKECPYCGIDIKDYLYNN